MIKQPFLCSLLGALALISYAVTSWSADFTIGISNAQPGSRVLLPVNLSGTSVPVAMQFDVLYGSENLTSEPIVKGPATFAHTVKSTLRSGGRRRVLIYAAPVSEIPDGVIIEIPFTLDATARGEEAVSLDDILVATADGSPVANSKIFPGRVEIDSAPGPGTGPQLSGIAVSANGIAFGIVGPEGTTFAVEISEDLSTWRPLMTATVRDGVAPVSDPEAANLDRRFYRVTRL